MRRINKITPAILVIVLLVITIFAGCSKGTTEYKIETHEIRIENSEGTFTKAEIIIPACFRDENLPLVTLGHGYRGNMNSAGGKDLAVSLAKGGMATIRMDFSHYREKDGLDQTNKYTVKTMESDQLLCIKYMIDNFNIDKDRIGLYARSLGGRVAMTMANENSGNYNYKAMALVAPAGNKNALHRYMGGESRWKEMKKIAAEKGSITHQKVILTTDFFDEIDEYIPSEYGYKFKEPVLVISNTLDNVVLPEASEECAASYPNVEELCVTSKGGHGYEMSYKKSALKDRLIEKITFFFLLNMT